MKEDTIIEIDGAEGEGGGQVLRSSLTLSMLSGKPLRIHNIRARRRKPGLLRQHLTCVKASTRISSAYVEGAEMGSKELLFEPGCVAGGIYDFAIGTAGSTSLVLQTILVPLLLADTPSTITIEGGTHNGMSPPFEFLQDTFMPIVRRMGGHATLTLEQHGFFPAGGGRIHCEIEPTTGLQPITLTNRGKVKSLHATALVSALPGEIAERELAVLDKVLKLKNSAQHIRIVEKPKGPGNALWLSAELDDYVETIAAVGERGVRAEVVAKTLAQRYRDYFRSNAVVGEHMADQLVLLLAIAGSGKFTASNLSRHTKTNIDTIQKFLDVEFTTMQRGEHWLIEVNSTTN